MKKNKDGWFRHYPLRNNRKIGKLTSYQFKIYVYLLEILFDENCKTVTKWIKLLRNLSDLLIKNEADADQILTNFENETGMKLKSNSIETQLKLVLNSIETQLYNRLSASLEDIAFECRTRVNLLKKALIVLEKYELIILKNNKIEIEDWFYYQNFRSDDRSNRIEITRILNSICYITCVQDVIQQKQAQEEGEGEGELIKKKKNKKEKKIDCCPYQKIIELWNDICGQYGHRKVVKLGVKREKQIKERWLADLRTIEQWQDFFTFCMDSAFLHGKDWFTLAWITTEENYLKTVEGSFHGKRN